MDATKTLLCAFVLTRLDYCNSLLAGCPKYILDKLQKVQNSAARLVFRAKKRDHVTPLLRALHWLPIEARVEYKLSLHCHNFFQGACPAYFSNMLTAYTPSRSLRSSADQFTLITPKVQMKTTGERSFAFCGPTIWNSLPCNIRSIQSTPSFKRALKTHLFKKHYSL